MRAPLAITLLALCSCGGSPTGPTEQPIPEPPVAEPPTSGTVTLDLRGTITFPDGRVAQGMTVRYRSCELEGFSIFPTCDFYGETVTGLDGRYTLTKTESCTFGLPVEGAALIVTGSANGECWGGVSEGRPACTDQPQAINVRLSGPQQRSC
jgi:hypothetical protein